MKRTRVRILGYPEARVASTKGACNTLSLTFKRACGDGQPLRRSSMFDCITPSLGFLSQHLGFGAARNLSIIKPTGCTALDEHPALPPPSKKPSRSPSPASTTSTGCQISCRATPAISTRRILPLPAHTVHSPHSPRAIAASTSRGWTWTTPTRLALNSRHRP
jgi:hypothetical protein